MIINLGYIIHTYSKFAFKGTVVNQKCQSINGSSIEITFSVPLLQNSGIFVFKITYDSLLLQFLRIIKASL